ncbi:MAG: PatB family C-S lyase [Desulfobulbaceae bacterium]|nr:PatB family C-S lyase [Desulfobulbaceae bacterium]
MMSAQLRYKTNFTLRGTTISFDFDTVIDRRHTDSLKWDKYKDRDILPLWVADMDFCSPPAVIEALRKRVDHEVFGYTLPPQELVETVVEMLAEEFNWCVKPSWLVWLPGLVTGLNVTCRAVGNDGDAVLTMTPVYPPFLSAPGLSGRKLITVPLAENNNLWSIDFTALEKAITPRTRLLLLCSPQNPVGRVFSKEELLQLAALAEKHDLVVCADEIHNGLLLDQDKQHIPFATLGDDAAQRAITLIAPSKTFNLPGFGCSLAIIENPSLRARFQKAMAGIVPYVNVLGYTAALAAYRDSRKWRQALLDYLRENCQLVTQAVTEMHGISMAPVEATYLAWLDCRAANIDNPATFFEAAGVGLSDGAEFGLPGFVRLNFGCPRATLQEALTRMQNALNNQN